MFAFFENEQPYQRPGKKEDIEKPFVVAVNIKGHGSKHQPEQQCERYPF